MLQPLDNIQEEHKKVKLVIFDLDGTLTESKMPMDEEMTELVGKLLEKKQMAVIGGGGYQKFQEQFLNQLKVSEELLKNLFLFPTSASAFYRYEDGRWEQIYAEKLSEEEKGKIFEAFERAFKDLNYTHPEKIYGNLIEDRGTEVTFSALGQDAPLELKEKWKEEHEEDKMRIVNTVQAYLPDFEVRAAGYTSIDVTRRGIDKEYGIKQINKHLGMPFEDMIFIGDALFEGGNDSAALLAEIPCFAVKDIEDTKNIIRQILTD